MDHVALLRGVNVGTAKRVAMADLRRVAAALGFDRPETLLNSGNLVFGAPGPLATDAAAGLRSAIARETGVDADLVLLEADRFARSATANPLRRDGRDPRLLSVAFAQMPGALEGIAPPDVDLGDEEAVVTPDAVYQWLPSGVLASRVPAAWWRALPTAVTARNDATVRKIEALLARRAR